MQAIASAYQDTGPAADYYPRFHAAVALAQLNNWLPPVSQLLVDISGPGSRAAELAAYAGHHVLRVIDAVSPPGDSLPASGADFRHRGLPPPITPGAPHTPRPPIPPGGLLAKTTSRPHPSRPPGAASPPWPRTGPALSSWPTAAPTA